MLASKLSKYTVILASKSPRRQQLIKDLNIPFIIKTKEVEEIYPEHLKGTEIADFLADLKAKPFKEELTQTDLLITSDTIVWHNNKALGKPKDYNDAFKMLKNLSDNTHQVITSICISNKNFKKIFNDSTTVTFKKLSDDEVHYYIENFQPFDKAGAYGIQEWIGKVAITKIEGSYFNVMGFPIHKLYKELINL
ncbi:septum formation protein Maf [Tenacibaculum finnmarkense genomovar finnmarkense]|uniref:dTTP/UTP pyrophosphatase n=1 Tax=Tenacibaculum finnmarkense genomovar finnmarkense TaxID=1458503 RepID=A0AAP1RGL4_9FLAO|nr:Maf-like protein [Tenacibaculum finnmarkense]MBE7653338.1 septum formation protein Maf [Tenacibaculum finnmarkense genomovar finnmarkense]MBE7695638.1 septum formation protein Maf [Tenacibaculum finnmarkense genomovar finnmarkense]MCD8417557.1 Maf-like protein [Tenacibaculum finnmarkense genomovar finnmarkense]MCD8427700.1 Maf-like protein [Tenacibaculum finnmarkense genomovar finnmarkense]MCG8186005.1 septum formation protein Maf [Tenacibaculum finnmarkense genomovar finnmarkense]